MSKPLPCPNPTCTHVFSSGELRGGAGQCPRCGFRVKGRTPASPPKVAAPIAQPVLAKPVAKPAFQLEELPSSTPQVNVELAAPMQAPAPVHEPHFAPTADTEGPLLKRRGRTRRGFRWKNLLTVLGAITLAAVLVLGGGYYVIFEILLKRDVDAQTLFNRNLATTTIKARTTKNLEEKVLRFAYSDKDWGRDNDLRSKFGANAGFRHKRDDVWLVVSVKDYGLQRPRDAEMVQGALEKLTSFFQVPDAFEANSKTEPIEFAGQQAQAFVFKGTLNAVVHWGKCVMFSVNGYGYWCFVGGADLQEMGPYFDAFAKESPNGMSVLTDRKGWREQPPETEKFAARNAPLTVTGPKGVWTRHQQPDVEFETGVLFLSGMFMKDKDTSRGATFQILTLDKQKDLKEAIKAAKDLMDEKKKEENLNYKLDFYGEGKGTAGETTTIGNRPARLVEFKLMLGEERVRYILAAVFDEGAKTYVIRCDCVWNHQQVWRQDFLDLIKTLQIQGNTEGEGERGASAP